MRELRQKVKDFSDKEKFVVQLMDELKIQENLVWDKHNGKLIGYVDLGDIDLNYVKSYHSCISCSRFLNSQYC